VTARGKAASDKGKRFERALAADLGTTTTRNTRPGAHTDAGDLAVDGWLIEARAREAWRVERWFIDAATKAIPGERVALVLKREGHADVADALVVIGWPTWKELAT
jgi:hypothetical protein